LELKHIDKRNTYGDHKVRDCRTDQSSRVQILDWFGEGTLIEIGLTRRDSPLRKERE
jgi:hypothetical protein